MKQSFSLLNSLCLQQKDPSLVAQVQNVTHLGVVKGLPI
jgi:hypothetical protein